MDTELFKIGDNGGGEVLSVNKWKNIDANYNDFSWTLVLREFYDSCPEAEQFVNLFGEAPGVFYSCLRRVIDSDMGKKICDGGIRPKIVPELLKEKLPVAFSPTRVEAIANQVVKFAEDKFGTRLREADTFGVLGKIKGLRNNSRVNSWVIEMLANAALMSTDGLAPAELAMAEYAQAQVFDAKKLPLNDVLLFRHNLRVQVVVGCNDLLIYGKHEPLDFIMQGERIRDGHMVKVLDLTLGVSNEAVRTGVFKAVAGNGEFGQHVLIDFLMQLEPALVTCYASDQRRNMIIKAPKLIEVVEESVNCFKEAVENGLMADTYDIGGDFNPLLNKMTQSNWGPGCTYGSIMATLGLGPRFVELLKSGADQETETAKGIMALAEVNTAFASNLQLLKTYIMIDDTMKNEVGRIASSSIQLNLFSNLVNEYLRFQRVMDPRIQEEVANRASRQLPVVMLPWYVENMVQGRKYKGVLTNTVTLLEDLDILANVGASAVGLAVKIPEAQFSLYQAHYEATRVPSDPTMWGDNVVNMLDKKPEETLALIDLLDSCIVTQKDHRVKFSDKSWVAPFNRCKDFNQVLEPLMKAKVGGIILRIPHWNNYNAWFMAVQVPLTGYKVKFLPPKAWHEGFSYMSLVRVDGDDDPGRRDYFEKLFSHVTVTATMFYKGVVERNYYQSMATRLNQAQLEEIRVNAIGAVVMEEVTIPLSVTGKAVGLSHVFNLRRGVVKRKNVQQNMKVNKALDTFRMDGLMQKGVGLDALNEFYDLVQ